MKDSLILGLKLFIITAIAGILLGFTYAITIDKITAQDKLEADTARNAVLAADSFQEFDMSAVSQDPAYAEIEEIYLAKSASGEDIGATFKMSVTGFNAGLSLTVGITTEGIISGVYVGSNSETPGLGANASNPAFTTQYTNKPADGNLTVIKTGEPGDGEILSIAAATKTSRGVTNGVNLAANCYSQYVAK